MDEDELWGPDYFDLVEPKGFALSTGMQELMKQCQNVELRMTPPSSPEAAEFPENISCFMCTPVSAGMPIQRSKFAKKQAKMIREEQEWLRKTVKNCWQEINEESYAAPITTEFVRRMSIVAVAVEG